MLGCSASQHDDGAGATPATIDDAVDKSYAADLFAMRDHVLP